MIALVFRCFYSENIMVLVYFVLLSFVIEKLFMNHSVCQNLLFCSYPLLHMQQDLVQVHVFATGSTVCACGTFTIALNGWVKTSGSIHQKKAAEKRGVPLKRPPRNPITITHLESVHAALDIYSPRGAAIWEIALGVVAHIFAF